MATLCGGSTHADPPDAYRDDGELRARLSELASGHPTVASVTSIGKTFEGRDLWVLTIGAPEQARPAILLDAAHDGRDLVASEVALRVAERLLESLSPEELIDLTGTVTLHVIPRANPDGMARAFASAPREQSLLPRPRDDDDDGQVDEDGPDDVNGDGVIGWMRVRDPLGRWTADPAEPRLLVERIDEDEGPFYRRYREGVDNDGDGLVNEDGEGGVALDHSFPQGWELEHVQPHAGPYATSERETVALIEHVLAHPEIAIVIALSQLDRPERPGVEARSHVPDADQTAYASIDTWVEALRGSPLKVDFDSPGSGLFGGAGQLVRSPPPKAKAPPIPRAVVPGRFLDWTYFQSGAFALAPQIWVTAPEPVGTSAPVEVSPPDGEPDGDDTGGEETESTGTADDEADGDAPEPRDAAEVAWIAWLDEVAPGTVQSWTPYQHPTLGDVELGGVAAGPRAFPGEAILDSLATEVTDLVVALSTRLPRVSVSVASESLTPTLHRVTATIVNAGDLPTMSVQATRTGSYFELMAEISVPATHEIVDGFRRARVGRLDARSRRSVEWLVEGPVGAPVSVDVTSSRAGNATASVRLGGGS